MTEQRDKNDMSAGWRYNAAKSFWILVTTLSGKIMFLSNPLYLPLIVFERASINLYSNEFLLSKISHKRLLLLANK